MKERLRRLWDSPTVATWGAYIARSGALVLVLPLALRHFSSAEVAVWYLFAGLVAFAAQADLGFRATFVRLIAYGAGGAESIESAGAGTEGPTKGREPNWELVERLVGLMRRIYSYSSIGVLVLLGTIGSVSLWRPIAAAGGGSALWVAWAVVCVTVAIEFQGKTYKNYLEGFNHVVLVRRVETLTRAAAVLTGLGVMLLAPSVLNLVLADRFWAVLDVLRDRYLVRRVEQGRWSTFRPTPFDRDLFRTTWAPAWRSGLGGLMSNGLTSLTGLLYAQLGASGSVAAYLLAMRLLTQLRILASAPLYSRIPLLGRLYAQGERAQMVKVARDAIDLSHATFVLGGIVAGLAGPRLLTILGSQTPWVTNDLWWLLCLAFFIHRVSAMHMQLYLTTNHVVTHIVDGVSGIVFIGVSAILLPSVGVYAFPIGMCVGYLAVHTTVSMRLSRRLVGGTTGAFIRDFVLPQACLAGLLVWLMVLT